MRLLFKLLVIILLILPAHAYAQGFSTIRDDETEEYLKEISNPIFQEAGLHSDGIKLIMVNSKVLNAFVAGGQNMFIHTGLMLEDINDPALLIGVMSHEAGHIAGGHLIRKTDNIEEAGLTSTIGYVLGAASVAVGVPPIGGAVLGSAGSHIATRGFLKHSREYEEAADQSAVNILSKIGISPRGLIKLLDKLNSNQQAFVGEVNPYMQTHPLSAARINHLKAAIRSNSSIDTPTPEKLKQKHQRITAKLLAFLGEPEKILELYKDKNTIPARYGRAVAYYRVPELDKAIEEIDSLIEEYPEDPYFHELRGQMLFENGYMKDAIESYEKTVELKPTALLSRLQLGVAQIAIDKYDDAVLNLKQVVVAEPKNSFAWHQLGIAHGRKGNLDLSYLALAEEAALRGNKRDVTKFIKLAKKNIKPGDDISLREKDIMVTLKEMNNDEK